MRTASFVNGVAVSVRPYVTARAAAELLGVEEAVVISDIEEGLDGALPALIGGRYGEAWIVHAFELESPRLEMHRARLTATSTSTVGQP